MISIAFGGVEIDLCGKVGHRVDFLIHRERRGLRVAEVFLRVSFVDAFGEKLRIIAAGPDLLAFLADDRRSTGVLAKWKDTVRGDLGIFQKHERDHAIVFRGFRVIEDCSDLCEMVGAQCEVDRFDCLGGKQRECFGRDFENRLTFEFRYRDMFGGNAFVFRRVGCEWKGVLIEERFLWHGLRIF